MAGYQEPEKGQLTVGIPRALGFYEKRGFAAEGPVFMDAGIPAIFIHRFEDPHYHTESDRAEFVEPQLLEEAAKLALLALAELASP